MGLGSSARSDIWQTFWQRCWRDPCQISERYSNLNTQSGGLLFSEYGPRYPAMNDYTVYPIRYTHVFVLFWDYNQIEVKSWDYKNPLHLDVVDRYLRRMGDKKIPDEAPPSLESLYPPFVAGIDLPQSRCCGFFVSFTNNYKLKCILRLKHRTSALRRLSHRRHPNKEVALNCMRRYGDGVTVICNPLRLNHIDMKKNINHKCTFVDLRHLCVRDSLLCVLICTQIPICSNG